MTEDNEDRLAEIKAWRHLIWGDNTDPLHTVGIQLVELDWLIGQVERLRSAHQDVEDPWRCPACDSTEEQGHEPGCWYAAELRRRAH